LPPPPAAPLRALGDAAGADGTEYYICITVTPAHVLGERVDHSLFRTTFLAGRNYGVCEKDGEPPFMVAKNSELTAEGLKSEMWVQGYGRASGGGGATTPPPSAAGGASASEDARTLAIKRTRIGDRYRALKDSVDDSEEVEFKDFRLRVRGPVVGCSEKFRRPGKTLLPGMLPGSTRTTLRMIKG
jgi:hypothetical protein